MRIGSSLFLAAMLMLSTGVASSASASDDHPSLAGFIRYLLAQFVALDFDRYEWTEVNPGAQMALSSQLMNGQFVVLEGYPLGAPKTKDFVKVLKTFEMAKVLIITPEENRALTLSARNVPHVQVLPTAGLNVYDILKYDHLVVLSAAVAQIETRLAP